MMDITNDITVLKDAANTLSMLLSVYTTVKIVVKIDKNKRCFDIFPTTHANQHVRMLVFDDMAKVFYEYGIQANHGYYKISIPYVKALNFLTLHKMKTGF